MSAVRPFRLTEEQELGDEMQCQRTYFPRECRCRLESCIDFQRIHFVSIHVKLRIFISWFLVTVRGKTGRRHFVAFCHSPLISQGCPWPVRYGLFASLFLSALQHYFHLMYEFLPLNAYWMLWSCGWYTCFVSGFWSSRKCQSDHPDGCFRGFP
jgi:hypothetical protein